MCGIKQLTIVFDLKLEQVVWSANHVQAGGNSSGRRSIKDFKSDVGDRIGALPGIGSFLAIVGSTDDPAKGLSSSERCEDRA